MIDSPSSPQDHGLHFARMAAIVFAAISLLPTLVGTALNSPSSQFLGYPYATDDHMVYAAWMRQAQDFRFFFDNRFAIEPQPGQTVHIYFFLLGIVSKFLGISWTTALAKAVFSGAFVLICHRLIRKFTDDGFAIKVILSLVVLGGGAGSLFWHKFGEAITKPVSPILSNLMMGRLPTDVWQPEGFVFPSMLTNSLFMVSLCLMLGIWIAVLEAKESWRPVIWGAACALVLANIHSYDLLLMGLVAAGYAVVLLIKGRLSPAWALRCAAIFAGAVPSALWLLHVLQIDPVFQARAATLTYSPNFRQIAAGYLFLLILGIGGWFVKPPDGARPMRTWVGAIGVIVMFGALFLAAQGHHDGYFLGAASFALLLAVMIGLASLLSTGNDAKDLFLAWALIGIAALYFPALFQRKLAIGLSIPWAVMAGVGISAFMESKARSKRTIVSALAIVACSASSALWLQRELYFIRNDVSRTTTHPLYLTKTMTNIVDALNERSKEKRVVIAVPGMANQHFDGTDPNEIDEYGPPTLADLNPIVSGLAGAYSYAGHWSETPNYGERRRESLRFFLRNASDEFRKSIVAKISEDASVYAIGPALGTFGDKNDSGFVDPASIGEIVVAGPDYVLVKIR